ncbi:MAG: hypothetical protein A2Z97_06270 [Bdellovibrionales bacterium GWB1_52_6]|nr:MAG: hypothetical protein A2Z97_06270 [Bdellovibrionales bacterium GWB1_52_6]OFZ06107.1 MAG: hypothetical protein A2X97_02110 [Bdellovibrionales bacterium GWA1_52_35]HCM39264.1 hypothetical protein [Bdellovibrionales bacterium]
MKWLAPVTPVSEERKAQLERELHEQEQRLYDSFRSAARNFRAAASPRNLFENHPIEIVLIAVATGIFIGKALHEKNEKRSPGGLELA